MLYYRYELRWKNYKDLMTLEKDERSEFEMKYGNSFLNSLNEDLYRKFLKNENYIITVSNRTDSRLELYLAVDIKHIDDAYETEIDKLFDDCDIIRKNEVTIEEYKRELSSERCTYSYRNIFDKLNISYRSSFFDPMPFELEEQVVDVPKTSLTNCRKRAKEILGSASLYEELERVFSKENKKKYYGHPVHYMISAGDWDAAKDIYELLLKALYCNKRLISNRVTILRNIMKGAYKDDRLKQVVGAAAGSTIIIELKSEDASGRFATNFHEFTKVIGKLMEHEKKDTLFLFVEISGKSIKDNDALNNILTKADVIQITEGTGTYIQAKKYLMELVEKVDFVVENKEDVLQFLQESETYSVTDIFNAYNAWYGSGLKNHIYKAYQNKKSFKVTVTKVEASLMKNSKI